jgi:hypothetical protein
MMTASAAVMSVAGGEISTASEKPVGHGPAEYHKERRHGRGAKQAQHQSSR